MLLVRKNMMLSHLELEGFYTTAQDAKSAANVIMTERVCDVYVAKLVVVSTHEYPTPTRIGRVT